MNKANLTHQISRAALILVFALFSVTTAWASVVTLNPNTGEVTLQDGDVLIGTGGWNTNVKIADGATVTLSGVNITAFYNNSSHQRPGITCLGDAVIVLAEGTTNDVKGGGFSPGIYVPVDKTLTLQGSGTLNATGGDNGAGIGSGSTLNDVYSTCGNITISGGTITANGGYSGAGIGSGDSGSCGNITITNDVTMVTATAGQYCDNAIGAGGEGSTCGTVIIGDVETGFITQSPFTYDPTVNFVYTISFDANGGTGTMDNINLLYGLARALTANSFTNWWHLFEGWATLPDGEKEYDDGQIVSNLTETPGATVTLYAKWMTDPAHLSVNGDEYTIHTATGWDLFCDLLANNSNGYFTGKTVKLDADITVTRMAGGSDHAFSGTFDGQGHTLTVSYTTTEQYTAPFRFVNGATITNLVTAGTISTSRKFAGGMIGGTLGGAVSITNCKVDVTINSSINGDGTHGGFIALASYGTMNITGCTFSGEMLGASTINCGGFVGWTESNNNATTTITDCLFAPTTLEISSGHTFSRARNMSSVTITNSCYTEPLGTAQGYPAVSDPDMTPMGTPMGTYPMSELTAYANGLMYGDTFYHDPNFVLPFVQTGDDEYTIYTATGWHLFCDALQDNATYNHFIGKTVKLDADISVTRMAGDSDHEFSGTFDGQGHTLTVSYTTTEQYTAPFRYVNGATITNLATAGTISTSQKFAGGMIGGMLGGAVSITNCKVDVTLNSSINGDGTHGGFIALASYGTLTITGCTFSGEMLGASTINCGGFVGWTESNNNVMTIIVNCLFAPTTLEISSGRTFSRARNMSSVTITNSYYTEPLGTAQGYAAVSNPAIQPSGDPTDTYPVSGLTAYANGLMHGDTFYNNPGATQTVALSAGWNWVSLNVEVTLNNLRAALMVALPGATNITINSQDNGSTTYNGSMWRGTLSTLDVVQMYKVQVPSSCQITLEGTAVNPNEHPITIHSGANWIGFPLGESKTLAAAFAGFAVSGDMVKSKDGSSTYTNRWRGTLTTLEPGKGYIYISASSEPRVLMFPPTGAIDGLFTINANGDQVYFSQGNLQYQASTNTWRFATNQYDCIGSNNSNLSSSYSGWIDLFGWGTSGYNHGAVCYQPWSTTSTSYTDYYAYGEYTYNLYDQTGQADWGYNAISNGGNTENSGWRTLTQSEWDYVFNTRSTASDIRYAKATVNGVNGIILLPDNWTASTFALNNTNGGNYGSNTITAEDWTNVLEANGAVFLPAAGNRYGTSVYNVGSSGYYWSASYDSSSRAYEVFFNDSNLDTFSSHNRYNGRSVRLVRVAEN